MRDEIDKPAVWAELPGEFHGLKVINVLGGGPSVRRYLPFLRELPGVWFGACRAGLLIDAEMTIGCDGRFPRQCPSEIAEALERGRHVVHPVRPHVRKGQVEHLDPRIRVIGWKTSGVSTKMDQLCGLDSGFAAFNAALLYRPAKVRLFGLDYTAPTGAERFHDGYPGQPVRHYDRSLRTWVGQYARHAQEIAKFGVDIELAVGDPRSRIEAFPTIELQELFA